MRERRLLVCVHPNKRSHLFQPEGSKTIPVPIKRLGSKTFFRVFGPYDTDYEVEASEVRETH